MSQSTKIAEKDILQAFELLKIRTQDLPPYTDLNDFAFKIKKLSLLKDEDISYSINTLALR